MEKPIEEWLSELPDGYRERALENRKKFPLTGNTHATSKADAVMGGFGWKQTPEGQNFWIAVHEHFDTEPPSLPPLPE